MKSAENSALRNMLPIPVTLFLHSKSVRKLVTTHCRIGSADQTLKKRDDGFLDLSFPHMKASETRLT